MEFKKPQVSPKQKSKAPSTTTSKRKTNYALGRKILEAFWALGIISIILGIVGLVQVLDSNSGSGLAIARASVSIAGLVLAVIFGAIFVATYVIGVAILDQADYAKETRDATRSLVEEMRRAGLSRNDETAAAQ